MLARIPRSVRAGRARPGSTRGNIYEETDEELGKSGNTGATAMTPYLNKPSEEAIFGSNKIKEEHETMKL